MPAGGDAIVWGIHWGRHRDTPSGPYTYSIFSKTSYLKYDLGDFAR
jgi:hypothetical protein